MSGPARSGAPAYRIDGRPVERAAFYAAACDPARPVVVEACAGAGKTWMLVSRIVRALLDGVEPRHVLAITFTRKAAGEMRQRLDEWLAAFAAADEPTRVAELRLRGLDEGRARTLAAPLGALQQRLLDAGRGVEIRTFHAWFSQLLRAAPLELLESIGLAPGLELMEDESELEPELFRRFHAAVLADPALAQDFRALVHARGRTSVRKWLAAAWSKRVEFELADRAGTLEHGVEPAAALDAWFDGLDDPACRLDEADAVALLRVVADELQRQDKATPRRHGAQLADAVGIADARARLAAARKALLTDKGEPRKHLASDRFDAAVDLLRRVQRATDQHDAHVEHGRLVRLARVLLAEYAALKRRRGVADMADLERCALALLRDTALAGWVQQRLDAQVRQLLIDEFQDTSPLQWQALQAWLSSYAGAGGGAAAPVVFIVGDPKQSIYRFRRAEPRVFAAAREFVRDALGGAALECDHTRRNAPGVLAAVNGMFVPLAAAGRYPGFRAHTTEVGDDSADDGPRVLALPGIERDEAVGGDGSQEEGDDDQARDNHDPSAWRDSLTQPRLEVEEHRRQLEARSAARAIAALVESGTPPGDVMVLARQRAPLSRLAMELQALRLPFASGESLELAALPEARDLIALLDALASPSHDLSIAQALRSALFGVDDDTLFALSQAARAQPAPCRWWSALMADGSAALAESRERLARWAEAARMLPPHDLLDRIVHEGDLHARVAARVPVARRASALATIDAMLLLALQLDGGRYPTLYGFVRALKRRPLRLPGPRETDAVQLLTVHGAKGLEAPVVLLLDADAQARNAESYSVLIDWPVEAPAPRRMAFVASESAPPPSLADAMAAEFAAREREELNGLYVAFTRARERVLVSHTEPKRRSPTSWWPLIAPHATEWEAGEAERPRPGPEPVVLPTLPAVPPAARPAATTAPGTGPDAGVSDRVARLGSALHRVLEWAAAGAQRRGAASLEESARAAAAAWQLEPAAAEEIARAARAILGSAAARPFFGPDGIEWAGSEVNVPHRGEVLRIDRLVARRDEGGLTWWVLDYKLAAAPQSDPALLEQLRRYRDAVAALQPGDRVRAAFLTAAGELVEPRLPD